MANLVLHLKKEYFDQIKSGEKKEEYREVTPYWEKRLSGRNYEKIIFLCGYPSLDDKDKTIISKWNGCKKDKVNVPLFGGDKNVFVISIAEIET